MKKYQHFGRALALSSSLFMASCQAPVEKNDSAPNNTEVTHHTKTTEQAKDLPDAQTSDWELLLVNKDHPLSKDYEASITFEEVDGEPMDARIVDAYNEMKTAAKAAGYDLYLGSAYRSIEHQQYNYDWNVDFYMEEGLSEAEAKAKTEELIAVPGYSEHHTGLALDILDAEWFQTHDDPYQADYDTQESQHWLVKHAPDYGFILRYPKGKEKETGINYESWHFRYVGIENAKYITEHQLTLEEYLKQLAGQEG